MIPAGFRGCINLTVTLPTMLGLADRPGELSFVPPDGKFILMGYEADLLGDATAAAPERTRPPVLPASVALARADAPPGAHAAFTATLHTLLEGMALAALVVWLFLRDWRSTAITAIAMPVSLIPTFLFMAIFHFSLNVVTLLALTLVIGILVDDAIVEIENIVRHMRMGKSPYRAALARKVA